MRTLARVVALLGVAVLGGVTVQAAGAPSGSAIRGRSASAFSATQPLDQQAAGVRALAARDTAGQTLYASGLPAPFFGDTEIYLIQPYSDNPTAVDIGTVWQPIEQLAVDPATERLYAVTQTGLLLEFAADLSSYVTVGDSGVGTGFALKFDSAGNGYAVGLGQKNTDPNLYRLDKTNASLSRVGNTGFFFAGGDLAFDTGGTLYASTGANGQLIRIDRNTGAGTLVGDFGLDGVFGLEIDTDGTMYAGFGSSTVDTAQLYTVDKNSGTTTLVGSVAGADGAFGLSSLTFSHTGGTRNPVADFTWTPTNPTAGQAVQFTDESTGGATSWHWNFGDGGVSAAQNPSWSYSAAGTYAVHLTVCTRPNACGSATKTLTVAGAAASLQISGPASAPVGQLLPFTAAASGCTPQANGWMWCTGPSELADVVTTEPALCATAGSNLAAIGWKSQGQHHVTVTNSGCSAAAAAAATVSIGPPQNETITLRPNGAVIVEGQQTVVFCHGLEGTDAKGNQLWSCVPDAGVPCDTPQSDPNAPKIDFPVGDILARLNASGKNITGLQFTWSGAFQVEPASNDIDRLANVAAGYVPARNWVNDAAQHLAAELEKRMPPHYTGPIQFVGHSLGTAVCALAAKQLLEQVPTIRDLQVTTLDRPDRLHVWQIAGVGIDVPPLGFGPGWLQETLGDRGRRGLNLRIDNYWSDSQGAVGDATYCVTGATVYNHPALVSPQVFSTNGFFPDEPPLNHSGVQQWYRWSMNPDLIARRSGTCAAGNPAATPPLNASLDPCAAGWNIALSGPTSSFPESFCDPAGVRDWCVSSGGVSTPPCAGVRVGAAPEAAGNATADLEMPPFATSILFDMQVSHPSAAAWGLVTLDSFPLWSGPLGSFAPNVSTEVGPVPIYGLAGRRRLAVTVLGSGSSTIVVNNVRVQQVLVPCSTSQSLCVTGQRFRVEADWTDHKGNSGHATPQYVGTDESGFMWFFDPSNLELIVKVLNGCGVNANFWVFAAGLTDVDVRLTVTDTSNGAVRIYQNPQGTAFQPIQDTAAFPTCTGADVRAGEESQAVSLPSVVKGAARTSSNLGGGRFSVSATWRTPQGGSGAGQFVPVTDDAGYLWFFDAGNIEAVVKVLNGCGLNNRFWVFAAGLTDVQVDLRVTDTRTGASQTYHNPQGQSFLPVQDTSAFATCP